MRASFMPLCVTCILTLSVSAQTSDGGRRFDAPPPKAALDLVKQGVELAGLDRFDEALTTLNKAIAVAPNYVEAHREYLRIKSDFQGKVDEAKAEYEALIAKEPDNPVYPMAMALGLSRSGNNQKMAWFKKIAELAPEWSWGHYAKAYLVWGRTYLMINEKLGEKGDLILAEIAKAIEKDRTVQDFYSLTLFFQKQLGRTDDAIVTAEKMNQQPELHAVGMAELWGLRLTKANDPEQAKESLKAELTKLAQGTRDIKLLAAIRGAYATLLNDSASADAIERQIHQLDPAWYPERGKASLSILSNSSGIPYAQLTVNRQYAIFEKAHQIALQREADWRKETRQYESLLSLGPNLALKKWLYAILFSSASKAGEVEAMIKYGEQLQALDPTDTAPFARIAVAMANKKMDLPKALDYARRADTALAEFRPMKRPSDIPITDFESNFSLEKQQENYRRQQAIALDAVGWVLSQMGQAKEAEAKLRWSVELNRTETSLTHLAEALKQLGQHEEAEKIAVELNANLVESVKSQLINRPAKDFQLAATDGRKYRLSDLKGKVVLVNTWATWCSPCVEEMPIFVKAYEKYKDQGFEILAISDDDPANRDRVLRFAKEHHLNFPVLYDEGVVAKLYDLQGYPGNVFIDRQGNIRYVQVGRFDDARRLEIILSELLK